MMAPHPRHLAVFVAFTAALAVLGACSRRARSGPPQAFLATSPAAAVELAEIRARWEERRLERSRAEAYLRRFPDDGATVQVRVFLAWLLIDEGKLHAADGLLAEVGDLPRGTVRDMATVARAKSLRLHGAPQSALQLLRPLVGKVVDDADRELFLEELALAAVGSHDDYEALAYMDAWLVGVGDDDQERVSQKIATILARMPRSVLEQSYRAMRTRGASSGYSVQTQSIVRERLAHIAVESNDAALARWLVELSGTSASKAGGDAGVELGELAASRRGLRAVRGRTLALLLPTRSRELRDESAEVVRGVSFALDLPRTTAARGDEVRLLTREDGVDALGTEAAMEELVGEGAAIVIAGFDRAGADRAAAWGERSGVPVILLAEPSPENWPRRLGVMLGQPIAAELQVLARAIAERGAKTAAFVTDELADETAASAVFGGAGVSLLPAVRCDVPLTEAGKSRFPLDIWRKSGATAWTVSGSRSCARDLVRDLGRARLEAADRGKPHVVGLTLEAGLPHREIAAGITTLSVGAGIVPLASDAAEEERDEEVRRHMQAFGVRPSYWTALGRDAGVLARKALAALPTTTTADAAEVTKRRDVAAAGLLSARARMWTSEAQGIGGDRRLSRSLKVVLLR
ncbi:MAG: hypothetical protein KC657_34190 [Myxococcales bacterium]|nr:hypothetical protein [Myxococcales bacterium]